MLRLRRPADSQRLIYLQKSSNGPEILLKIAFLGAIHETCVRLGHLFLFWNTSVSIEEAERIRLLNQKRDGRLQNGHFFGSFLFGFLGETTGLGLILGRTGSRVEMLVPVQVLL